jgi:hypothetical protein
MERDIVEELPPADAATDPTPSPEEAPADLPWFRRPWTTRRLLRLIAVLALPLAVAAWLGRAVDGTRRDLQATVCYSHLYFLGHALQNYRSATGSFPPAHTVDPQGRPLLSWRVLLQPWCERLPLYQRFSLGLPWDDPANLGLMGERTQTWTCPNRPGTTDWRGYTRPGTTTPFLLLTGPGTAWPDPSRPPPADLDPDTILAVECVTAEVPWTAPVDLDVRRMNPIVNDPKGPGPSSHDPRGPHALTADGRVVTLEPGTRMTLKAPPGARNR